MNRKTLLPLACFLFVFPGKAFCDFKIDSLPKPSIFSFFYRQDVPKIKLKFDYDELVATKDSNLYRPGEIEIPDSSGVAKHFQIGVKAKGHARRKICGIPPLKIKFSGGELLENGFDPAFQTLELVLLCDDDPASEQYVLREYAAYRLYNLLTDKGFRAQLVILEIRRANGKTAIQNTFAIVLENKDEMAARLGGWLVERHRVSKNSLNPDDFDRFCLFQYLIANTDWAVLNSHNMVFVGFPNDSLLLPVPFDFDYAGIVATPYAIPHSKYPIQEVTQRLFLGPCRPEGKMLETVAEFRSKREEMLGFCKGFEHWNKSSRRHVKGFVESFFELTDDPKRLRSQIIDACDFPQKGRPRKN